MNELVTLKDIAGYEKEKEEAIKIIDTLKNFEEYKKNGVYIPKGLILSGLPGVGKTMFAKAIANEASVPLYEFENSESEDEIVTIKNLKEIFTRAKKNSPSIVFIDELDELVSNGDFISDYSRKILKTLLTEIDGVNNSSGIMVIATTNYKERLPKALIRSGRMDKNLTIEIPDTNSREKILRLYLDKYSNLESIDSKLLASKTSGLTGADIKTLINETMIEVLSSKKEVVSTRDFENMIPQIIFKNIKKGQNEEVEEPICYHELGHFICNYALNDTLAEISVEKYGEIGGFIMIPTNEDEKESCKSLYQLKNEVTVSLAGIACQEVMLNEIYTGASSDINKARICVRDIIESGMCGFECIVDSGPIDKIMFEMTKKTPSKKYMEKELEILEESYQKAKKIVNQNKPLIIYLMPHLKEKRRLSEREIEVLVKEYNESIKEENVWEI